MHRQHKIVRFRTLLHAALAKIVVTASVALALTCTHAATPPEPGGGADGRVGWATKPDFRMPFQCGEQWRLSTRENHGPEWGKVDFYRVDGTTNGAPVLATASGTVNEVFSVPRPYPPLFHNPSSYVEINHGGGWFTLYVHMTDITVRVGDRVHTGQQIGLVGALGSKNAFGLPGPAHLHYELMYDFNHDNDGDGDGDFPDERVYPWFQGQMYPMVTRSEADEPRIVSTNLCGPFTGGGHTPPDDPNDPTTYGVTTSGVPVGATSPACLNYPSAANCSPTLDAMNVGDWIAPACQKPGATVGQNAYWVYGTTNRGKTGWIPSWWIDYPDNVLPNVRICTGNGGGTPSTASGGKSWVDTFGSAPGYSAPGNTRTGTLYAGTNYVYCKTWGPNVQVGSDYNHWWLRTDLDEGNPWQSQWVSAYYLSRWGNDVAKDNNGVVIPDCGSGGGPAPGNGKWWADTFAAGPGHSAPGGSRTGTLNSGTNYVYCKTWGPNVQVGSNYNHWWLRTDLDAGSPWQNQWVSAYYLTRWGNDEAKDNNGVVIPDC